MACECCYARGWSEECGRSSFRVILKLNRRNSGIGMLCCPILPVLLSYCHWNNSNKDKTNGSIGR